MHHKYLEIYFQHKRIQQHTSNIRANQRNMSTDKTLPENLQTADFETNCSMFTSTVNSQHNKTPLLCVVARNLQIASPVSS